MFHYFENIVEQIAIAYILHNRSFFNGIKKFYKFANEQIRRELKIAYQTTNYGNISFSDEKEAKCLDDSERFFPFYEDWQKKWKEFNKRFADLDTSKKMFVLKLDFVDAYGQLDVKNFFKKSLKLINKCENQKNKKLMEESIGVLNSIWKSYDIKRVGVPYGGPVESHIFANFLILLKLVEISKKINENKNFKVIDIISYADDSCILIECEDQKMDERKNELKEIINGIASKGKNKIHEVSDTDKSKTFIFQMNSEKDYLDLRNSYSSLSTVNAIFLAQKLSDNDFEIDLNKNGKDKNADLFERKSSISKIYKAYSLASLEANRDLKKFLNIQNMKSLPYMFVHLLKRFNKDHEVKKIINTLLEFERAYEPTNQISWDNIFENKYQSSNEFFLTLLQCYLIAVDSGIPPSSLASLREKIVDGLKKSKYLQLVKNQLEYFDKLSWSIFDSALNKEYSDLLALDKKIEHLSKHIIDIAKKESCSYKDINIYKIFGIESSEQRKMDYWKATKVTLLNFYSKVFEEKKCLLFYRYKAFLQSSENRIEFIENMKYLKSTINSLSDINNMQITEDDENIFKLIKSSPDMYAMTNDDIKNIDKLILVRQLTKLLWDNGSLSTQTYTLHNHIHGDKLLIRFHEFRKNEMLRNILNNSKIEIYPLIASFYLHDLGMLLNVDPSREFFGEIKKIYTKIAEIIRSQHGDKSADILYTKLASLLQLPSSWITPISLASIAHQNGVQNLVFENNRIQNNALILSILDLFDITFERSSILSRLLTGQIANDETRRHWQKHYIASSLEFKIVKIDSEWYEVIFTVRINTNVLKNSQYSHEEFSWEKIDMITFENTPIGEKITREIKRWFEDNAMKLLSNISNDYKNIKLQTSFIFEKIELPENHNIIFYGENDPNDSSGLKVFKAEKNNISN